GTPREEPTRASGGTMAGPRLAPTPANLDPATVSSTTSGTRRSPTWMRDSVSTLPGSRATSAGSAPASCRMCDENGRPPPPAGDLDHEVHEPVGNDDRLPWLAAVQMRLHPLGGERERDELVLGSADRHVEPVTQLPVHLHDDLDRVGRDQRQVGHRPGRLPEAAVSEALPQLLGDVWGVRLDERD